MKHFSPIRKLCHYQLSVFQRRGIKKNTKQIDPVNESTRLTELYTKLHHILTNKDALVQHLINSVVHEDENIVAINKPAGLAMKAEKKAENDARIIDHVSFYQTIEDLRQHFNLPDMNLVLPLSRTPSGIILLGKTKELVKKLSEKIYRAFADRQLHQTFQLICVGNPINRSEEVQQMLMRRKEIQGRMETLQIDKLTSNARKRGEGRISHHKLKVLTERADHIKCAYVELMTTSSGWDSCELFMTRNLSPILGDHIYFGRVAPLLGHLVCVDPELATRGPQKLPKAMLEELGISVHEEDRLRLPLHLHRSSVTLEKFPTKKSEPLTISACVPEYFETALQLLDLKQT